MIKTSKVRADITVNIIAKTIALVITLLDNVVWTNDREKILRTVAAHYNLRVVV